MRMRKMPDRACKHSLLPKYPMAKQKLPQYEELEEHEDEDFPDEKYVLRPGKKRWYSPPMWVYNLLRPRGSRSTQKGDDSREVYRHESPV